MAKKTKAEKAVIAAQKYQQKQEAKQEAKVQKVEKKILKKNLTFKKVGAVLDIDEYNDLKTKLGSDSAIAGFAARKGIKLDSAITNPKPEEEKADGPPAEMPGFTPSTAEGLTPAVFDFERSLSLINAQGNINTNIQKIESDANRYISELQFGAAENIAHTQADAMRYGADQQLAGEGVRADAARDVTGIEAGATRYVADQQLAGEGVRAGATRYVADQQLAGEGVRAGATRYVADRQLESDLGVENIRAKGAIDLQGIINAGAANVENIRGEFNVKGKKVDRSTAILGGLVSAFNF